MRRVLPLLAVLLFLGGSALGTIFGTVRGIVHDPQHRPVTNAHVTLQARKSAYTQTLQTDGEGEFHFDAVPLGEYSVKVEPSMLTCFLSLYLKRLPTAGMSLSTGTPVVALVRSSDE